MQYYHFFYIPNKPITGYLKRIPIDEGWLYLAVVIDLCSRRLIIGWKLGDHMESELVVNALD